MASTEAPIGRREKRKQEIRSRIEDADFAQEIADLTRDRILREVQARGLQVHGRQSRAVLDLLG